MLGNAFSRRREIELILMSGKKVTTQELMYKFEVGKNTIRNDIDFLSPYLPIISKQGYGGGYYLAERYSRFQNSLTKEPPYGISYITYDEHGNELYHWEEAIRRHGYIDFIQYYDLEFLATIFWILFAAGLIAAFVNRKKIIQSGCNKV